VAPIAQFRSSPIASFRASVATATRVGEGVSFPKQSTPPSASATQVRSALAPTSTISPTLSITTGEAPGAPLERAAKSPSALGLPQHRTMPSLPNAQ